MKKTLSLALALAMCLGLAVPAFAAEAGDTVVTAADSTGTTYTLKLSNPIVGVRSIDYEEGAVVYQVPEGTTITPEAPAGSASKYDQYARDILFADGTNEYSFSINLMYFGKGMDDEEGDPEHWVWFPDQGEPRTDTNWLELYEGTANVSQVTCRKSWDVVTGNVAGRESAEVNLYFEIAKTTSPEPTDPDQPVIPAIPVTGTAYASTQSVLVDGKAVEFEMYALKDEKGNDTNYIKLRDLAQALNGTKAQFEVGWNGAVNIETGKAYTPNGSEMRTPFSGDRAYEMATAATNINGEAAELTAFILKDDNGGAYTYYQLRDLGKTLGFNVSWSAEKGVYVETDKPYEG